MTPPGWRPNCRWSEGGLDSSPAGAPLQGSEGMRTMKCPFCHHDNEEGVLFCEQCKSDLGILEPTPFPDLQAAVAEAMEAPPARSAPAEPVIEEIVLASLAPPAADAPVG